MNVATSVPFVGHPHLLPTAPMGRGSGHEVGIDGIGGLRHVGIKLAAAMGERMLRSDVKYRFVIDIASTGR